MVQEAVENWQSLGLMVLDVTTGMVGAATGSIEALCGNSGEAPWPGSLQAPP